MRQYPFTDQWHINKQKTLTNIIIQSIVKHTHTHTQKGKQDVKPRIAQDNLNCIVCLLTSEITEHGLGRSVTVCLESGPSTRLQTSPLMSVNKIPDGNWWVFDLFTAVASLVVIVLRCLPPPPRHFVVLAFFFFFFLLALIWLSLLIGH